MMNIEAKLNTFGKKTIEKSELETLLHTASDEELFNLVSKAISLGLLKAVKSSGKSGNMRYPLYMKYRILSTEDYSEELSEISMLHPAMLRTGYLKSKPELYSKYKLQLQQLNSYLFKKHPQTAVSKKERSFEIFSEEKQLEDLSFCNLLEHMELSGEALCYYETPEYCFNDYIPGRKDHMVLLICENKDIWFNIRRRMYESNASKLFGAQIDGIVYGCGNRVSEAGALSGYTRFLGATAIEYLYWGDIDRAGLNIYLSLLKNNPKLNIRLFVPGYEKMLSLSENRSIPESCDHRELTGDYEKIYEIFPERSRSLLIQLIESNKRLPQEIVNYELLLKVMR